jgi:hypothetical protein
MILEAAFFGEWSPDYPKKRVSLFFKGLEVHEDTKFTGNFGDNLPKDPVLHLKIPDSSVSPLSEPPSQPNNTLF